MSPASLGQKLNDAVTRALDVPPPQDELETGTLTLGVGLWVLAFVFIILVAWRRVDPKKLASCFPTTDERREQASAQPLLPERRDASAQPRKGGAWSLRECVASFGIGGGGSKES